MGNLSTFVKRIRDIMRNDAGINGDAQRIEQIAWMLFLKVYDAKEQDWEFDDDEYTSVIPEECRWRNWAVADSSGQSMTGDTLLNFVNNTLFPTLKNLTVTPDMPIKKSIVKTTFEDANNYMKDGVLLRQVINIIDELDLSDTQEVHAFGEIYEAILRELQSAGSSGEFYTPRAVTEFMAEMIKPEIGERMADFACGTGGFITSWLKALAPQVHTTEDQRAYDHSIYGIEKKQFPYMLCITNMLLHGMDVPQIYHDNSLMKDVLDYTEEDKFEVILMNPPYGGSEKADVKSHFPSDLASSETADLFMSVIMYRLKKNGRAAVILPDGFLFGTDNAKIAIKKKLLKEFNLHTVSRMPGSVFAPYTSITTNILFFSADKPTEETWFYRLDMPEGYKHFSKTKPMKPEHFDPVRAWWNDRRELTVDGFSKSKKYTVAQLTEELGYNLDQCGFPHEEEEILDPMDLIQRYQEERASLNAEIDRAVGIIFDTMNGIATSPSKINPGVLGRLIKIDTCFVDDMQKSVLQLAIQGRLVPQRPEEGTGEDLFRQIQSEKQTLIKAGKIKKEKPLSEITEDEIPFDIPDSWKWCRIGDLFQHNTGKALNSSDKNGTSYEYITTSNVYWNEFKLDKLKRMLFTDVELDKCTVRKGDLLVLEGGDVGRAAIWNYDFEMRIQNHIHRIRPYGDVAIKYFYYIFLLYKSAGNINGKGIGIKGLSANVLHNLPIPLPPLAEQKRIVARLEELLPLCEMLR